MYEFSIEYPYFSIFFFLIIFCALKCKKKEQVILFSHLELIDKTAKRSDFLLNFLFLSSLLLTSISLIGFSKTKKIYVSNNSAVAIIDNSFKNKDKALADALDNFTALSVVIAGKEKIVFFPSTSDTKTLLKAAKYYLKSFETPQYTDYQKALKKAISLRKKDEKIVLLCKDKIIKKIIKSNSSMNIISFRNIKKIDIIKEQIKEHLYYISLFIAILLLLFYIYLYGKGNK